MIWIGYICCYISYRCSYSFRFAARFYELIITSFLADRTQAVKCNQTLSSSVHVTSGVPEGSVIGPVRFVLFINDLPSICYPCTIKLYADDVKVYFAIHDHTDRDTLQQCLDRIYDWSLKWELKFSYDKCQFLQLGYFDQSLSYHLGSYVVKPNPINMRTFGFMN